MRIGLKNRKLIHYSLVISTILIQMIIFIFFFNEYFNENKLTKIREQLEKTKNLQQLTNDSRIELLKAHSYLDEYINYPKKENLDFYFQSLKNVAGKIDSAQVFKKTIPALENMMDSIGMESELQKLDNLIDSVYKNSPKLKITGSPLMINKLTIEQLAPKIETKKLYVSDSIPKKNIFSRIRDAITGDIEVKTDTVYISTTFVNSLDTTKIISDFDSTLLQISKYYQNELTAYQQNIRAIRSNSQKIYDIYNNLIGLSHNLIEIYELSSDELRIKLEEQYAARFSRLNTIRRYTVFCLMLILFFVLFLMIYFTRLSFVYEKELKEANEKNKRNLRFKNRILGMLSHEIRSPLKIMNIFIQRIIKKTTDESIIESLKSIQFTNNSLLIQAGQILDYTKNEDKPLSINPVQFNLNDEIELIFNIFKPYIESVNNVLVINNEIPADCIVTTDKAKIHQVYINLLGNANKFTENGKISVQVKTEITTENDFKLFATIADTGSGISEKDLQHIFEPYYKGEISEQIENVGAGLGLSLCKEIIELFQGNITIKSEPGKGSRIHFEIFLNRS